MPAIYGSVSTVAAVFPTTASAAFSVPVAPANGSQVIILDIADATAPKTFSGLSGWSGPIECPGTGESNRLLVWWKNDLAGTGLSAGTTTITWTGSVERVGATFAVDARLNAYTQTDATPYGTSHACPSVTAPTGGGLWVQVLGSIVFGGRTATPPGGVTEIIELDSGSLTNIHAGTISVSAGATGAGGNWTSSDGNSYGAVSLLFANPSADAAIAVADATLSLTQAMPDLDTLGVLRQSAIGSPVLGGNTASVTYPQIPLSGSLLVVVAGGVMPGVTGGSVASVPALEWTPAAVRLAGAPTDTSLLAWVAKVGTAPSSAPVVTFTRTPAGDIYGSVAAFEVADSSLTVAGLIAASANGTGASAAAPVTSTAASAHLLTFVTYHASSASATVPSTWAPGPAKQGASALVTASKIRQAVAIYTPTWTLSESTTWCAMTLALQAGGGGTGEGGGTTPTAPTITTASPLPTQVSGASLAIQLAATGSLPMTWSLSGAPSWLQINPATGQLTGIVGPIGAVGAVEGVGPIPPIGMLMGGSVAPTGTFYFTVTAANGTAPNASKLFEMTIVDVKEITTASLPTGTVGAAYSATINATATATSFTLIGQLPAGLSFAGGGSSATISGTPTLAESRSFDVRANYASGETAIATLTITVNAAGAVADTGGWSRWLQR